MLKNADHYSILFQNSEVLMGRLSVLIVCVLAFVPAVFAKGKLDDAKTFLARREYSRAISAYEEILKSNPGDTLALKGLAEVYSKERDWENALKAWQDVLKQLPGDRDANGARWSALLQRAKADSTKLAEAKELVKKEALSFLETLQDKRTAHVLAYLGLRIAEADSAEILAMGDEIVADYPESATAYEIAGERFYDGLYPIWSDDTLKVRFLDKFLKDYQVYEWRLTAFQYLLSSLTRLKDLDGLREYGDRMISEDSLNPFAFEYYSYILLEMDMDTLRALELAKRAIALEPGYGRPRNKPVEEWELDKGPLGGSARREAARALAALGRLDDAKKQVQDAIKVMVPSLNDYATKASLYYTLGLIQERRSETDTALKSYVQALVEGDMTNKWSGKADTAYRALYVRKFGSEEGYMAYARKITGYRGAVFTDVTEQMGLKGSGESRIAWADFNNDGYDDILLCGSALFLNVKGETFENVTENAGIADKGGNGAVCADFDNDGNMDFYAIGKFDKLFKGKGDGTFEDVTAGAGAISDTLPTEGAGWGDYDADGHVDLYCANYEIWGKVSGMPDFLYHNNGDGTFLDVTKAAGIVPPFEEDKAGRGVNWGDFDNDGDLDIYVSNYRLMENFLWRNNGDGTFTNVAALLGVAGDERDGWWGHTIGSEWGDYDNDGDLDLVTANLAHPRYIAFSNKTELYENMGPPEWKFVDRREKAGIKYDETHSDPSWGDVDADGDLDLYMTSIYEGRRSFLYENTGNGRFRDITWLSGVRAFNGWGCAFSDFDRDGDLDLFVASGSGCHLYRNDGNGSAWLEVQVSGGTRSNRAAIGSRVTVKQGGRTQIREVEGGKGTTSQHSLVQFFGFGRNTDAVDVTVRFPSGTIIMKKAVPVNQRMTVEED
jgi:tetratricopeptide (TPR) repeat protein